MNYLGKIYENMMEKLLDEQTWTVLGEGFIKIVAILIMTGFLIRIGKVTIQKTFAVRQKSILRISERREATLIKLLQNVLTYAVYFISFIMILSTLTIDVKALLAGAGIVGLAVGFGAQNLVKDIITGFFIIFEDQFSVGDFIRVGQFEGFVEEIGLRTTKIKNWTGEVHILPNGSIVEVTNFSINNSMAVVDISIAYEGDIDRAEKVIQDLLPSLSDKYEDLIKEPELLGVQNLGASDVILRVIAETLPMRHFHIGRMLRKELKIHLDQNGIEIPFPRMVMYSRSDEPKPAKEKQEG